MNNEDVAIWEEQFGSVQYIVNICSVQYEGCRLQFAECRALCSAVYSAACNAVCSEMSTLYCAVCSVEWPVASVQCQLCV